MQLMKREDFIQEIKNIEFKTEEQEKIYIDHAILLRRYDIPDGYIISQLKLLYNCAKE